MQVMNICHPLNLINGGNDVFNGNPIRGAFQQNMHRPAQYAETACGDHDPDKDTDFNGSIQTAPVNQMARPAIITPTDETTASPDDMQVGTVKIDILFGIGRSMGMLMIMTMIHI